MSVLSILAYVALWTLVFLLGFFLIGALRAQAVLAWRLEPLEATMPRRIGRDGLKIGTVVPGLSAESTVGDFVTIADYRGRRLLLVFSQCGCGPCHDIVQELHRLLVRERIPILVVNHGSPEEVRRWASEVAAQFPVLIQPDWEISKRFEVFATPFGFVLDERGVVVAKGLVSNRQHLQLLLAESRKHIAAVTVAPAHKEVAAQPFVSSM